MLKSDWHLSLTVVSSLALTVSVFAENPQMSQRYSGYCHIGAKKLENIHI